MRTENKKLRINIQADTTKDELISYLKENDNKIDQCYMIASVIEGSVSARIRCEEKYKDDIIDPDLWPEHVAIRRRVFKPREQRSAAVEDRQT